MHLLAARPGEVESEDQAVDLQQSPGDIVFLSAADSELSSINDAWHILKKNNKFHDFPTLRLANFTQLKNHYSTDLYIESTLKHAKIIIARILGGHSYWPYGIEEIAALAKKHDIRVGFLPGHDKQDESLHGFSSIPDGDMHVLWQYLLEGGPENSRSFLLKSAELIDHDLKDAPILPPKIYPKAGIYSKKYGLLSVGEFIRQHESLQIKAGKEGAKQGIAAIFFYKAFVQSSDLAAIDKLMRELRRRHLTPLAIFVNSLKDSETLQIIANIFQKIPPHLVINTLGFSLNANINDNMTIDDDAGDDMMDLSPYLNVKVPVLQVILSSSSQSSWQKNNNGLSARDIAMYVALSEMDGNIFTRAVSFKKAHDRDPHTEIALPRQHPNQNRVCFVADLARKWVNLQFKDNQDKKIALILANYPNKDGRVANGVGLDSPKSLVNCLKSLQQAGYDLDGYRCENGNELIDLLLKGPTNANASFHKGSHNLLENRIIREKISLADYEKYFQKLPKNIQKAVVKKWGNASDDPFTFFDGKGDNERGYIALPFIKFSNIVIAIQPSRGYHIDPDKSYHDPALVPPHAYFACYFWLRHLFCCDAMVHLGKHGNLEWLPGKSLALSRHCYPEILLGPCPHIYPFIVNDPGEGSQAKRRASAVIIDHLTPPMARATSYGQYQKLENLCDEYFESCLLDPRRAKLLKQEILDLSHSEGIAQDCGFADISSDDEAIEKLDGFLCDIKEMQIRNGLHIFMQSPADEKMGEFATALLRHSRPTPLSSTDKMADNENSDKILENLSILSAICYDLGFDADLQNPLEWQLHEKWRSERPAILQNISHDKWRSFGDGFERIEQLALNILTDKSPPIGKATTSIYNHYQQFLRPRLDLSARREKQAFLNALSGKFVAPGPSGAPTRGRLDVLPTGRNFFSVDCRAVPTMAAWKLGFKSANMVLERHAQETGDYPKQIALSVWGTSNMRTGGDDIAQALAFIGARPCWDDKTGRVTGFEILPVSVLGRPRIDVTLRISGFFRDSFSNLIHLFDSACRQIMQIEDEGEDNNPLHSHFIQEKHDNMQKMDEKTASLISGRRIFGSKSGAYGAGLQALMDEKIWQDGGDIADTFLQWGAYSYGALEQGTQDKDGFSNLLARTDAVLHNQDNREHDILDSDDYYQFEGGLTASVKHLSGKTPAVYHNDHSNPDAPKIRTLQEEIARVVRGRAANPKWINAMKEHGYKGAFEMSASLDYLFAFAATTGMVKNHHFDILYDCYIHDDDTREFIKENNINAYHELLDRFDEAIRRDLWKPRRNDIIRPPHIIK